MIRHCITEGDQAPPANADLIQLRAKRLGPRELLERYASLRSQTQTPILINDRLDVCLAAGAAGVHLPSHRIAPQRLRERFGAHLIIGVSCHSLGEVRRAADEGASYVYLSPIFETASKPGYGPPLGLEALSAAARAVAIPVLALGGITANNEAACLAAGAAGIAGISYFGYS
jgi:thiamine-phosphate pyrophosphorylase